MEDSAETIEKMYGPTITMDRYGKVRVPRKRQPRILEDKKGDAVDPEDEAQKQADRVQPVGQPLEPWGDREVEITPEDVARAILEFNERVPEAAGLLQAGDEG